MTELLPRGLLARLTQLLRVVPVVVLEGPRACGKTAVGSMLKAAGSMVTVADLSDPTTLAAATASPTTFVESLGTPAFIDEVQLVPELTVAVKRIVDRTGDPGAFVLTGSSRLGRTELGGSDPLAGRAARVRLWPMTQGELGGSPVTVIPALFADDPLTGGGTPISPADLQRRIARGGIPTIAGVRADVPDVVRPQLIAEYVEGVLHHETGRRHDRAELLRTYRYLAATTARLLNTSNVADDLGAKRETVQTRIATLDGSFLLHSLAARRSGEHRTLTAHPKVHVIDTSIATWASRAGTEPPPELWGALVETFVVNELCAQAAWSTQQITVRHWRDTARKLEVDAVIAAPDGRAVGVEVKAGADVRPDDLKGLTALLADDEQIHRGVVFYTGAQVLQLSERIWAVPISALWEDPFDRGQQGGLKKVVAPDPSPSDHPAGSPTAELNGLLST